MGVFRQCRPSIRSSTVSKTLVKFQSASAMSNRLISSNISAVSKTLLGFYSASPSSNRLISSNVPFVSKRLLGLESGSPTPNRLISSKISVVSKNFPGFQSGSPMLYRVTSSTTLCCVKISDGPKSLLGFGFDKKVNNPLGHFLGTRPYSVHVLDKYMYQPLIKCLGCVTFFTGRFETVPFTKERLYVFPFVDKIWGEWYFRSVKEAFKTGFVLPQSDPQCIRVESIAIKILEALQRETCRRHKLADRKWLKGDDGEYKVVRERREENVKVTSAYLDEGIDWEFFVPDTPTVNAAYINIGKILVFRGFFDLYKTDEELAIAIATEVYVQYMLACLLFQISTPENV